MIDAHLWVSSCNRSKDTTLLIENLSSLQVLVLAHTGIFAKDQYRLPIVGPVQLTDPIHLIPAPFGEKHHHKHMRHRNHPGAESKSP